MEIKIMFRLASGGGGHRATIHIIAENNELTRTASGGRHLSLVVDNTESTEDTLAAASIALDAATFASWLEGQYTLRRAADVTWALIPVEEMPSSKVVEAAVKLLRARKCPWTAAFPITRLEDLINGVKNGIFFLDSCIKARLIDLDPNQYRRGR